MTNVRDVFRRPGDGEPVPGVWVQVDLVPPGGTLPAEEATIFTTSRVETDSGGAWQFDLPPTVNGDSAYTSGPYVYLVSASYSGQDLAYHIDVPTSLETVWAQDIRTDPPDPEIPPDPTPGDGSFVAVIDGNSYDVETVEFTADVDAQIVAAETLELGVADTIARTAQLTAHEADQTTHGVDFTQLVDIAALGAAVEEARTVDAQLYEDDTGNLTTDVVTLQLLADAVHGLNIGEGGGPGAVDDLNDLDDVNLTGLVTGQGLTYNGALFVPTDLPTQIVFDAHLDDTAGAHVASAISFIPDGSIEATDVQSAIQEVRDEATGGSGPLPDVVDELQLVSDLAEAFEQPALVTLHDDGTVSGQFASPYMLEEFLLVTDAGDALDTVGAAPAVHTHDAEDLTGFQTLVDSSSIHFTDAGTDTSAAVVSIAGEVISSGTVADARIASTIARDSEVAALSSVYQPLDSDLTAIAGVTTSSFGRSLLTQTDAAALRTTAGAAATSHSHVGTAVSVDPTGLIVVSGTNVQSALAQLDAVAGDIENQAATATGDLVSTTIRGQLDELDARVGVQLAESPDLLDTVSYFFDDFIGGGTTSGAIGEMGWRTSANVGTVTANIAAIGLVPVIGCVLLESGGAAANNYISMYLGSQASVGAFIWQARLLMPTPLAGNSTTFRFGLGSATDATQSANGMYFECASVAASTIKAITSSTAGGGTAADTETDTGVAATGTFQKFTIVSSGAGQIDFYINDALEASHTTDIPANYETWQPFFSSLRVGGAGASKLFYVDYCYMKTITVR